FGKYPNDAIPTYAFRIPFGFWDETARRLRSIFLFSDRPLYQPGDTVHLKGVVRDRDSGNLILPNETAAQLWINNPDDKKVWEKQITLSRDGTFAENIALPRGRLGGYNATIDFGQNVTQSVAFRVEEYRPNAFETSI